MAAALVANPGWSFAPSARAPASAARGSEGDRAAVAHDPRVPTNLYYGTRVGLRSCAEGRYVSAHPKSPGFQPGEGLVVEVSGYHPFRQGDATDRALECPSEWMLLHFSSRQHKGPVRLGDEVCFAKELSAGRKERYAFLALAPAEDGSTMEPAVERGEGGDSCRWTVLHADNVEGVGPLRTDMPVRLRGSYNECLALGRPALESRGSFRSPSRMSGRSLVCKGRDGRAPALRFRIVKAGVPFCPEECLHMGQAAPPPPSLRGEPDGGLASMSQQEQEQALLEDVLFCLLGVDGVYIRKVEARFDLRAPPGTDPSIVQFLQQVLPVCSHHVEVQQFVEEQGRLECGTVSHALCAAMRELLGEFSVKVGQLESALFAGNLSIAKLWYHLQAAMDTFAVLRRIAAHVRGRVGGAVLTGIEEVMARSSLTAAQDLCEYLLQHASRPYFEILSKWVYEGKLEDPYGEFFISESTRVRDERFGGPAADFWQKHFVLEEEAVPQFLASSMEEIRKAGKYLHVLLSASPNAILPEVAGSTIFKYSRNRQEYAEAITVAHRRASAALLGLFMSPSPEGLDLPGRLESLRSFFFLGRADWFGQLLDTTTAELEQPAAEVPLTRLDTLLDLAIRASSVAADPYRDDISCGMHSFRIEDACQRMSRGHLLPQEDIDAASDTSAAPARPGPAGAVAAAAAAASATRPAPGPPPVGAAAGGLGLAGDGSGIRSFTLKYRTSWPLSIVFSRALLLKYQVIFRHLLYCRYVERKLVEVWVDHQYTKELGLETSFSPSYSLRQRMLHFCRDYIYYATVEVLEPRSHSFLASLMQASSIDEVLQSHERFLDGCLREILLTEREGLYRHLSKVLQTCLSLASNLHRLSRDFLDTKASNEELAGLEQAASSGARRMARIRQRNEGYLSLLSQRQYSKIISKFKVIFESQLQGFLRQIQQESTMHYEPFLSNLATRLDYNEYYSSMLRGAPTSSPPPELDSSRMSDQGRA